MLTKILFKSITLCSIICLLHCSEPEYSSSSHPEFVFMTVGSSNINARFGVKIYQALDSLRNKTGKLDEFLFTIAEEPLTPDQVRERSSLTQAEVEYIIAYLDSCNFIKRIYKNQWATTLPVITDNQMKNIRMDLAPMANSVTQYFEKAIPRVKVLYDEVRSPSDPSWQDVSHLIVDKLIIDATFHRNLNRLKRGNDIIESDEQTKSVMPAFLLHRGENFSNFGCNWYKFNEGGDQREVYVLHGAILDRYDIKMEKYRGNEHFSACLFSISPDGDIGSLTYREKEMLRDLNWIADDHLLIHIVKARTIKSIMPELENIGREAAEIAFDRIADITDSYESSNYSQFISHKEDYIQVLIHSLFGLTIEQLVNSGTVSHVPEGVPESFGVFIVDGRLY